MLSRPTSHRAQALALALLASSSFSVVSAGPCDIYASGGTPCVAAHSTTRALYSAYSGNLYQVKRAKDGTTTIITPVSAGGIANSAAQDTFCSGTTCTITEIYDQSGKGNHLTAAPPGSAGSGPASGGYDNVAGATDAPVYLDGKKVYGVYIGSGDGYRNDNTNGIATGDAAEGIYAVLDGTHYNGGKLRCHPRLRARTRLANDHARLLLRLRQRRDQRQGHGRIPHGGYLLR
jgi:non-reducing end alpha-L-arabinofuranosidase